MSRPQITLRYEYLKRLADNVGDETVDAPDGWESMTEEQRHKWCQETLEEGLSDYIGTSYEWETETRPRWVSFT